MKRRPKQIGTEGETAVARYLLQWFPGIHRLAPAGDADCGDLGGVPDLTIQVKVRRELALAEWVDQSAAQAERAGTAAYVVVHKRRGKGDPGQWYVTTRLEVFAPLYAQHALA